MFVHNWWLNDKVLFNRRLEAILYVHYESWPSFQDLKMYH